MLFRRPRDCRLTCEPTDRATGVGVMQAEPTGGATPSITLFPVFCDWSRFGSLQLVFTVEGDPLPVTISVRDGRRVKPPQRRFDLRELYPPGSHTVRLDLKELSQGTVSVAGIDVSAVQSLHVILEPDGRRRVVRLHRVWLE
jgi:hypothetical protein